MNRSSLPPHDSARAPIVPRPWCPALLVTAAALALSGCAADDEGGSHGGVGISTERVLQGGVDMNDLMTDQDMRGHQDVTAAQVQQFLSSHGSLLATYSTGGQTAAELIVANARANTISPVYILARLQIEQQLISDHDTSTFAARLRGAAGYDCPDNQNCPVHPQNAGLAAQVNGAASLIREYYQEIASTGATRSGRAPWRTFRSGDPCNVTPANDATAALYTYTPWVGAYAQQCGTSAWGGSSAVALTYRSYAQEFGLRGVVWSCADSAYGGQQWWTCAGGALHRCDGSGNAQTQACPNGCTPGPVGTNDQCNGGAAWSCANSAYGGRQWWTCSNGTLYRCDANGNTQTQACTGGCTPGALGTDDRCNGAAAWSCDDSAWNGQQYWSCGADHNRHRCDGSGHPQVDACQHGCLGRGIGRDDLCVSNDAGWSCANSAWQGSQFWTCSAGAIHECDGAQPVKVQCPAGCSTAPYGVDDSCN